MYQATATAASIVFVFSKCFHARFGAFSNLKCIVKGGTNLCIKLLCHIKVKDLLDIYKWGCGPFCVSLLLDRCLEGLS